MSKFYRIDFGVFSEREELVTLVYSKNEGSCELISLDDLSRLTPVSTPKRVLFPILPQSTISELLVEQAMAGANRPDEANAYLVIGKPPYVSDLKDDPLIKNPRNKLALIQYYKVELS